MRKFLSLFIALFLMAGTAFVPARADIRDYFGYGNPYRTTTGGYFYDHPYVQKAVIVGGTGAAVGALVSREGNRVNGAVKGALIGAGAGIAYQYLRDRGGLSW